MIVTRDSIQGQTQDGDNGRATTVEYLSLNAGASAGKRAVSGSTLVATSASATVLQPRLTPKNSPGETASVSEGRYIDGDHPSMVDDGRTASVSIAGGNDAAPTLSILRRARTTLEPQGSHGFIHFLLSSEKKNIKNSSVMEWSSVSLRQDLSHENTNPLTENSWSNKLVHANEDPFQTLFGSHSRGCH